MVVCVEILPADKPWDVVSATRRSSGGSPRACARVYARVLVPPNLYIHTYIHQHKRSNWVRVGGCWSSTNGWVNPVGAGSKLRVTLNFGLTHPHPYLHPPRYPYSYPYRVNPWYVLGLNRCSRIRVNRWSTTKSWQPKHTESQGEYRREEQYICIEIRPT